MFLSLASRDVAWSSHVQPLLPYNSISVLSNTPLILFIDFKTDSGSNKFKNEDYEKKLF